MSLKRQLVEAAHELDRRGLNRGSSGNCSVRISADRFLVTPSAVPSLEVTQESIVCMNLGGDVIEDSPNLQQVEPSSEWRFHRDIYRKHSGVGAIVHIHSTFATSLSCLRRDIPAFHYMVAVGGGTDIRCAPYATFGTDELSNLVLQALDGRRACLLANHGMIATGVNLSDAVRLSIEVEALAQQFLVCLSVGQPSILTSEEIRQVLAKFSNYQNPRQK